MFDNQLLKAYAQTVYGYGRYEAPCWFIGMEEGGGDDPRHVAHKLDKWDKRGRPELTDLRDFHSDTQLMEQLTESSKLQPTWEQLIRILLTVKGEPDTRKTIFEYQELKLGRADGETCVVELLPLPSPNSGTWIYPAYSLLPELRTRKRYMKHFARPRAEHLKARIQEHTPAFVVFYGINPWHKAWWQFIADVELARVNIDAAKYPDARYYIGDNGRTVFAMSIHPTARVKGVGKDYFATIGKAIADRLQQVGR
jgi:hypothetical protein